MPERLGPALPEPLFDRLTKLDPLLDIIPEIERHHDRAEQE